MAFLLLSTSTWLGIGAIFAIISAAWVWVWTWLDPARLEPRHFPIDRRRWAKASGASESDDAPATEDSFLLIGAGFSGLGIAGALKRFGIPFEVAERTEFIGGNWRFGVYYNVNIISSRNVTEFKDFPMPADYPDFPSARQMLAYLQSYAKERDLERHVMFKTEVLDVSPIVGDDGESRQWRVRMLNLETNEEREAVYKGCIIANGHHWDCLYPAYAEGGKAPAFEGTLMHSKAYKEPSIFEANGKYVVVGGGNSACDILVDAAREGADVYWSLRSGKWILPRSLFGVPLTDLIKPWVPAWVQKILLRTALWIVQGNPSSYGLPTPHCALYEQHPTINSEVLGYVKRGGVKPRGQIAELGPGRRVTFQTGEVIEDVDAVITATGFNISLPMLSADLVTFEDGIPQLVGGMLHRRYRGLYVFGIGQPRYGAGSLITLGGDLVGRLLCAQEGLSKPIGFLLEKCGVPLAKRPKHTKDLIEDPHVLALRLFMLAQVLIPLLPRIQRWVA